MSRSSPTQEAQLLAGLAQSVLDAAEAAQIGVTVTVNEDGALHNLYMSEQAARMVGLPREEANSRNPMASLAPEELPRMAALVERRRRGEQLGNTFETVMVRPDGQRVPIATAACAVTMNGRPVTVSFFWDISERKASEAALRQSESRQRQLIDAAPEAIFVVRAGLVVECNPAAVRLVGAGSAAGLTGTPFERWLSADALGALGPWLSALRQPRPGPMPAAQFVVAHHDGTQVRVEASGVTIDFDGAPAMLLFVRDITERAALQAQLERAQRLTALGTLAAGVAHEVNNPLTTGALTLDLLDRFGSQLSMSTVERQTFARLLEELRHGNARVAAVVRDLRQTAQPGTGEIGPVELEQVLAAAQRVTAHVTRMSCRVSVELPPLPKVEGDASRLEQVLVNLLMNAAQAMPEGRAGNHISVSGSLLADGRVELVVADNGPGIAPDVLGRIFDPFFTTKPAGVGMGLGLFICQAIVTQLGGELLVSSVVGRGTTFRVRLRPWVGEIGPAVPEAKGPAAPTRARVLLIDDEPGLTLSLKMLLEDEADVVVANTAAEALRWLRDERAQLDVVLCDLMMPEVSGMDLYEQLALEQPVLAQRVVFMTGGAFTPRAQAFLQAVTNPRLEKPFPVGQLKAVIRQLLAK